MIILFSVITVAANTYKSNSDHKQKLTRMIFPFLLHKEFLRVFWVIPELKPHTFVDDFVIHCLSDFVWLMICIGYVTGSQIYSFFDNISKKTFVKLK